MDGARPLGPLARFFICDHRRLDEILRSATAVAGHIDPVRFEGFRGGLLRHIGRRRCCCLRARRAQSGQPLPVARLLRADHGAIAALLVPTPTPEVVEGLLSVLRPHNALE